MEAINVQYWHWWQVPVVLCLIFARGKSILCISPSTPTLTISAAASLEISKPIDRLQDKEAKRRPRYIHFASCLPFDQPLVGLPVRWVNWIRDTSRRRSMWLYLPASGRSSTARNLQSAAFSLFKPTCQITDATFIAFFDTAAGVVTWYRELYGNQMLPAVSSIRYHDVHWTTCSWSVSTRRHHAVIATVCDHDRPIQLTDKRRRLQLFNKTVVC